MWTWCYLSNYGHFIFLMILFCNCKTIIIKRKTCFWKLKRKTWTKGPIYFMDMWQSKDNFLISARWLLPYVICSVQFYGLLQCLTLKEGVKRHFRNTPTTGMIASNSFFLKDFLGLIFRLDRTTWDLESPNISLGEY